MSDIRAKLDELSRVCRDDVGNYAHPDVYGLYERLQELIAILRGADPVDE